MEDHHNQAYPARLRGQGWELSTTPQVTQSLADVGVQGDNLDEQSESLSSASWEDEVTALQSMASAAKRDRSPSSLEDLPNKRARSYNSPGMLRPSRPEVSRQFFGSDLQPARGFSQDQADFQRYDGTRNSVSGYHTPQVNNGIANTGNVRYQSAPLIPQAYPIEKDNHLPSSPYQANPHTAARLQQFTPPQILLSHQSSPHTAQQIPGSRQPIYYSPLNQRANPDATATPLRPSRGEPSVPLSNLGPHVQYAGRDSEGNHLFKLPSDMVFQDPRSRRLQSPIWPDSSQSRISPHVQKSGGQYIPQNFPPHTQEDRSRDRGRSIAPKTPRNRSARSKSIVSRVLDLDIEYSEDGRFEPQVAGHFVVTSGNRTPINARERAKALLADHVPVVEEEIRNAKERAKAFLAGHTPVVEEESRRRAEIMTPVEQRARSRSVGPLAHTSQRAKNDYHIPETPRMKGLVSDRRYDMGHQSSQLALRDEFNESSEEGETTPLEQLARKSMGKNHARNLDDRRYRASSVLPKEGIQYRERPRLNQQNHHVNQWVSSSSGGPESPINLISSPEITPMRHSVPMKDRGFASKKKETQKAPRSRQVTAQKNPPKQPADEQRLRQKRAAQSITDKEKSVVNKVLECAIFGEVLVQSPEEKEREGEKRHEEAELKRREKEVKILAQEELEAAARLEEKRAKEAAAKEERLLKEREEKIKQVKREAARRELQAREEAVKEEKRKKALEQIEESRRKEAAEAAEKVREREKMAIVQAETLKLEEMRIKQEAAKLQAASLKSASIYPKDDSKKARKAAEESLFVAEEGIYDVDDRAQARSQAPRSAAEVFSQPNSQWLGRKSFQEQREEFEREQKAEAYKKRLANMKARLDAKYDRSAPEDIPQKKPGRSQKDKRNPRLPPNPKARATQNHNHEGIRTVSVSPAIVTSLEEVSITLPKQRSTPTPFFPSAPPPLKTYSSQVKLASEVERERIEKEKRAKKDQINEARRKKDAEKARAKLEVEFLKQASDEGWTITPEELNKRLDARMKKREVAI